MVGPNNTDQDINVGEILECTVEQIMPYGAFVRITKNGRKGMIHISELSYSFVKNISDVLNVNDKINAKVIKIDEKGRIDLSLKQTQEPPAQQARPPRRTPPVNRDGTRENFRPSREPREPREGMRDFHEMQEAYREANPEEADSFEKKMSAFLKTSEAKITDLNSRNSSRSGRNTRRRNNNSRDY
ncbi:MAG: S1 RNA-binding domain-containing protein [Synergistaceae bacterium]|nr:S1 RNA-binding domain-containing protein [Synergistaceae bacterium]